MKTTIDFQVLETFDTRYLSVADYSDWGLAESRNAIIEITLPASDKPVTHYFDKKAINRFNSILLGLNCSGVENLDLPDGIYQFTVKGSPDSFNFKRDFLKTDLTQLDLDKFIVSFDISIPVVLIPLLYRKSHNVPTPHPKSKCFFIILLLISKYFNIAFPIVILK